MFQSTHLHEVRRFKLVSKMAVPLVFQSTHLHEVRPLQTCLKDIKFCFNPRTYMRGDASDLPAGCWRVWFQSTHLHEVRRFFFAPRSHMFCFNPRTYMRCDVPGRRGCPLCCCFNPRTYMRCDLGDITKIDWHKVFQSTHLHEVRPEQAKTMAEANEFQSTHLHEVRLRRSLIMTASLSFNPRTYMRCDVRRLTPLIY